MSICRSDTFGILNNSVKGFSEDAPLLIACRAVDQILFSYIHNVPSSLPPTPPTQSTQRVCPRLLLQNDSVTVTADDPNERMQSHQYKQTGQLPSFLW